MRSSSSSESAVADTGALGKVLIPAMIRAGYDRGFAAALVVNSANALFLPLLTGSGVPVALKPLVGVIELISNYFVRPFSLTVRLFANMLAGHILLVTFALLTSSLVTAETKVWMLKPMAILPFFMLIFLTAFEVLVAFLQAYIFTILTAVYIGGSAHPEH